MPPWIWFHIPRSCCVPEADTAFVPLADILRPPALVQPAVAEIVETPCIASAPEDVRVWSEVARDVRVFRAQLADAFDAAREMLLRDFAFAVLGRELLLGDADLAAIVARILAEHPDAQPLRVRVAPVDLAQVAEHVLLPLVADPDLESGDAIVDLQCGSIDARLGVRIAALLERAS